MVAHGDILRQITATSNGSGTHGYVLNRLAKWSVSLLIADYHDSWLNAEAREYVFDPDTLDGDCFLIPQGEIAVAGGYGPTSTEADIVTGKL